MKKTCNEELQQWHVPKKIQAQNALLFDDFLSRQL
jgi:hypothetical protein